VRRSMAHLSACAWANTDCAKNAATRYRSSGLRSSRSHRLASIVSTSANARSRPGTDWSTFDRLWTSMSPYSFSEYVLKARSARNVTGGFRRLAEAPSAAGRPKPFAGDYSLVRVATRRTTVVLMRRSVLSSLLAVGASNLVRTI
jgi:hypothetical protein